MLPPVGQMMMANEAGPQGMGRIMGVVAIPVMLAPVLGPTLGGLIVDNFSWRWIFFVNVPIGAVALVAAFRILPRGERVAAESLDVLGLVLLAFGVPPERRATLERCWDETLAEFSLAELAVAAAVFDGVAEMFDGFDDGL